ncbi:hypothetical protein CK203_040212 [Vitis vinifera]|uniref:DUF4283 domain-containing protein n=1 Tax=Vitis vinifera TaxID=29760 RepID=A0A438HXC5_VITVI|nr:hypothetical protein CK203_040212 [Vitis vinifera]
MVKPRMDRSFAEMVKGSKGREGKVVRVEVGGEEISENLCKLEHCLVGSWNPSSANGVDLERLGWLMARSWGLQGKLGLARLEKGKILLEFEYVGEAKRVLSSGNRLVGGVQLGLERWSPRCGCEEEGGSRKEAWTEKMEDLEWARILVKIRNEVLPSMLDIVVEEACYSLSLWLEVRPEMRKVSTGSRSNGGSKEEVRGDAAARATPRVEELESVRPEALLLPADGIDGQDSGAGGDGTGKRVQVGYGARAFSGSGGWALPVRPPESRRGSLERACLWARAAYDNGRNCEAEFLKIREKEDEWKQQMASSHSVIDRALIEEELRYGSALIQWGDTPLTMLKSVENGGGCWDLVEVNIVNNKDKEWERGSNLTEPQEVRGERENRWEECNLAKFSQFLGFSTEGLEKEILKFFGKIRKRRERIYSRGALEKTKFERELKRLECSINYEGGSKQRSPPQGKGCQLVEVNEA